MDDIQEFEQLVRDQASRFRYPRTPDLSLGIRARLEKPGIRSIAWPSALQAAAVLALIVSLLMVSIPEARAVVRDAFRIGVIELIFGGDPAQQLPETGPLDGLAGIEQVAGQTTLAAARAVAPFEIPLPDYPASLGAPDHIYYQEDFGPIVVLVWMQNGEPALSLHMLGERVLVSKLEPVILDETTVNGQPALWTQGPYLLELEGEGLRETRLVGGSVLIWTEGRVTYRLESGLPLQEARRVAESLNGGR